MQKNSYWIPRPRNLFLLRLGLLSARLRLHKGQSRRQHPRVACLCPCRAITRTFLSVKPEPQDFLILRASPAAPPVHIHTCMHPPPNLPRILSITGSSNASEALAHLRHKLGLAAMQTTRCWLPQGNRCCLRKTTLRPWFRPIFTCLRKDSISNTRTLINSNSKLPWLTVAWYQWAEDHPSWCAPWMPAAHRAYPHGSSPTSHRPKWVDHRILHPLVRPPVQTSLHCLPRLQLLGECRLRRTTRKVEARQAISLKWAMSMVAMPLPMLQECTTWFLGQCSTLITFLSSFKYHSSFYCNLVRRLSFNSRSWPNKDNRWHQLQVACRNSLMLVTMRVRSLYADWKSLLPELTFSFLISRCCSCSTKFSPIHYRASSNGSSWQPGRRRPGGSRQRSGKPDAASAPIGRISVLCWWGIAATTILYYYATTSASIERSPFLSTRNKKNRRNCDDAKKFNVKTLYSIMWPFAVAMMLPPSHPHQSIILCRWYLRSIIIQAACSSR